MEETQPLDDAVVEIDQLRFAKAVYIELRSHISLSFRKRTATFPGIHFAGSRTLARSVPTTMTPAKPLSSTAFL